METNIITKFNKCKTSFKNCKQCTILGYHLNIALTKNYFILKKNII